MQNVEETSVPAATESAHSWKDLLIQVALITVSVIVALAFDGLATMWSQRALVREARANLSSEVQDNRKELQLVRRRMDETDEQLKHGMRLVIMVLTGQEPRGEAPFGLGMRLAEFQASSRVTAEATGAFALMKYDEVKQYTRVYAAQDRFVAAQQEFLGQMLKTNAQGDLLDIRTVPSRQDLQQLHRDLRLCAMSVLVLRQFADDLAADYERVSKKD